MLISQEEALIEHWVRQPDGLWLVSTVHGLGGEIEIASISCRLALAEVYERVA